MFYVVLNCGPDSMDVSGGQGCGFTVQILWTFPMDKVAFSPSRFYGRFRWTRLRFHRKLKMIFEKGQRSVSDSRVYLLLV